MYPNMVKLVRSLPDLAKFAVKTKRLELSDLHK